MRTRKIRGHRRRWKNIQHWAEDHKQLDLDYLKEYERDYAKIRLHPWSSLAGTNSRTPEPKRETKAMILEGLIHIHDTWKTQLDQLREPYYLKLWLFEPHFSNSQVVCAIRESIHSYDDTFHQPDTKKVLPLQNYGRLSSRMSEFIWDYHLHEEHWDNSEPGSPEEYARVEDFEEATKRFRKMMKKPHRTTKFPKPIGEATEYYSFKKGSVWLGEQ